MEDNTKLNIEDMKKEVEKLLENQDIKREILRNGRGTRYWIDNNEFTFEFTLGGNWVGYGLDVRNLAGGGQFGIGARYFARLAVR